jgi:DNA polymerase III delta prime subunit
MSLRKNTLEDAYKKIISEATVPPTPPAGPKKPKTNLTNRVAGDVNKINSTPQTPGAEASIPALRPRVDLTKLNWKDPIRIVDGRHMPELTMEDYKRCILRAVRTRGSLLVYGDPGVGKTKTIYKIAPSIGRQNFNREFIAFHEFFKKEVEKDKHGQPVIDPKTGQPKRALKVADNEKLKAFIANPEKYYVLIEIQAQTLEPVDLSGLYDIQSQEAYISRKIELWAFVASLPGAAGILFFDEFNMAPQEVQNAFMKVTHPKERMVGTEKLAEEFCVIAAANLSLESGRTALDSAQTNRFSVGFVILDPPAWLEWAREEGIHETIIAYVKSGTQYNPQTGQELEGINPTLYSPQDGQDTPFPTPRAIELWNADLLDINAQHEQEIDLAIANGNPWPSEKQLVRDIKVSAAAKLGDIWAEGFALFMNAVGTFEIKDFIANPDKYFNDVDASQISHIVHYLMTYLKKYLAKRERGEEPDEDDLDLIVAVATALVHFSRERTTIFVAKLQKELTIKQIQDFINFMHFDLPNDKLRSEVQDKIKHVGAFKKGRL